MPSLIDVWSSESDWEEVRCSPGIADWAKDMPWLKVLRAFDSIQSQGVSHSEGLLPGPKSSGALLPLLASEDEQSTGLELGPVVE